MTDDEVLALCLELPGAWPDAPWGDGVVAKVGGPPGKVFAFPGGGAVALKLAPEDVRRAARRLPGRRRTARRTWRSGTGCASCSTARCPTTSCASCAEASYALVVRGLPRAQRPQTFSG